MLIWFVLTVIFMQFEYVFRVADSLFHNAVKWTTRYVTITDTNADLTKLLEMCK